MMAGRVLAALAVLVAVAQPLAVRAAVRFCLPREGDAAQCAAWFAKAQPALNATCVVRTSDNACLEAIKSGEADMTRGGGNLLYSANAYHDLQVFLAEDYGMQAGTSYYGVAVVKKEFCDRRSDDVRLSDLKGLRMCTTGYRRTAGWTLPIGFMVSTGLIPVVASDKAVQQDAQSVAAFYSSVCAPGTTDGPGNSAGPRNDGSTKGQPWERLCTGCSAGGQSCTATSAYSDYQGALRCLVEGAGDVAFMKHTTPSDYETSQKGQAWATTQSELRLVCADSSGCKPVTAFDSAGCSYAHAPAHAFVGRPSFVNGPLFARALAAYSLQSTTAAAWIKEGADLGILSAATVTKLSATRSGGQPTSIVDYITPTTYSYFRALRSLQDAAPESTSGGNDGLSAGAIAGIVIGSVVGTALLVAAGMWLWSRRQRRSDWERWQMQNSSAKISA